jgi:hypothetical protein
MRPGLMAALLLVAMPAALSAPALGAETGGPSGAKEASPAEARGEAAPPARDMAPDAAAEDDAQPAAAEAEAAPRSPFGGSQIGRRSDALDGVVELSSGAKVPGRIYMTRGQDLLVRETPKTAWQRVPPAALASIVARVDWERMDRQWRFKTAGNPEKVYTGKTYPNRRLSYVLTLRDGKRIEGRLKGVPLYVEPGDGAKKPQLFVLHERQKGRVGQKLKDLVYVAAVRLGEDVRRAAEEELNRKAAEAARRRAEEQARGKAGQEADAEAPKDEPAAPAADGGADKTGQGTTPEGPDCEGSRGAQSDEGS